MTNQPFTQTEQDLLAQLYDEEKQQELSVIAEERLQEMEGLKLDHIRTHDVIDV